MGKRKIECNNKSCKHHVYDGKCDTCIVLDEAGKCQSFEKGFAYYFHIVWNALGSKNFIDAIEVKQKTRSEDRHVLCDGMLWVGIF